MAIFDEKRMQYEVKGSIFDRDFWMGILNDFCDYYYFLIAAC